MDEAKPYVIEKEIEYSSTECSILEYAKTEMRSFEQLPFNEVDSLILTKLCYMHFKGAVPQLASGKESVTLQSLFMAEFDGQYFTRVYSPVKSKELFWACCASPRFRNIRLNYFTEKWDREGEKQFSAITFILPDGSLYIAFRGTDSTVVGWKEDFNMMFQRIVPSQEDARLYLDYVADMEDGRIYIGGHSKGGTMAMYSAVTAQNSTQDRIDAVFNHDGPGLADSIKEQPGYKVMKSKIHTTLPQNSMIGILFSDDNYKVIKSDRAGVMQHDPFSWIVENGEFVKLSGLSRTSRKLKKSVNQMMQTLTVDERKTAVDTIFSILESTDVDSFRDIAKSVIPQREKIIEAIRRVDNNTYSEVGEVLADVIKIIFKNLMPVGE